MRWRGVAVAIVLTAGVGAGCGDGDEGNDPGAALPPDVPATGCSLVADEVGFVEVVPRSVSPGGRIELFVENRSGGRMTFGVAYSFQRLEGGEWEDATVDVYGGQVAFPEIALVLEPGERVGGADERFGGVVELPSDLEPGTYRAAKHVTLEGGDDARLCGAFAVR